MVVEIIDIEVREPTCVFNNGRLVVRVIENLKGNLKKDYEFVLFSIHGEVVIGDKVIMAVETGIKMPLSSTGNRTIRRLTSPHSLVNFYKKFEVININILENFNGF